jgi:ribonuclease III
MSRQASPLEERLGHVFGDPGLLERAVTHPSAAQDRPRDNNQRLEFLGDSVLQWVLTSKLFELYPDEREGALTRRRSALTQGAVLAALARECGIDRALILGSGEEAAGGRSKDAALEDAFEAVLGALYLDAGMDAARAVILRVYGDLGSRLAGIEPQSNPKGRLQERVQPLHGNGALEYVVRSVGGVDHARVFEVEVLLLGKSLGSGRGTSKKEAEEEAALRGLAALDRENP